MKKAKLPPKEPLFYGSNRREERIALGKFYASKGGKEFVQDDDLPGLSSRRVKKAVSKLEQRTSGKFIRLGSAEKRVRDLMDAKSLEDIDAKLLRFAV